MASAMSTIAQLQLKVVVDVIGIGSDPVVGGTSKDEYGYSEKTSKLNTIHLLSAA